MIDLAEVVKKYGPIPPKPTADEMKAYVEMATALDAFLREKAGPHDLAFYFYSSLIFSGFTLANIGEQLGWEPEALAKTYGELLTDWLGKNTKRKATGDDAP